MRTKPAQSLAAAKWILIVGGALFVGVITLTHFLDKPSSRSEEQLGPKPSTSSASSPGHAAPRSVPSQDEIPPWQAARQEPQSPLPPGVVPASAINPPPPDTNAPLPPEPVEPPNPATNRP